MMKNLLIFKNTKRLILGLTLIFFSSAAQSAISYALSASPGAFTPNSAPTTIHSTSVDDALSAAINIGFTFNFGGCTTSPYTQVKVSSNGWLSLGTGATGNQATNDMAWSSYGPLLAPLWDDLSTGTGKVDYQLTGAAGSRVFTVEWLNMKWNWSAGSSVISFQVKLYEANGKIEYVYRQEAGGINSGSASIGINGGVAGDFYSLNGTGATPNAVYGTATNNLSTKPATGQIYSWDLPGTMTYSTSTATQASILDVYQGSTNQEILAVQVNVAGGCSSFSLTQMQINMNGTTALADVTNIDVYYTGTSSTYATSTLFGSVAPAAGNLTVNGSQALQNGTNYFWIVYDIAAGATIGDLLDAQCNQVSMNGGVGNKTPTITNPPGSRPIVALPGSFAKWIELGWAKCVVEASATDMVWAGSTTNSYSSGGSDVYVAKTNTDLSTIYWTRSAGTAGSDEYANDITKTADGFVIVGTSNMAGGAAGNNILVMKVNTSGVVQWTKTIGTAGTDEGSGIVTTTDGHVAICGTIDDGSGGYDGYFAKIDNSTGNILIQKKITTTGNTYLRAITQTSDGGYLMGGQMYDTNRDFYIVKLTSTYTLDWGKTWGGGSNDEIIFVLENGANDYTVGGESYSYGAGSQDGYIIRFTSAAGVLTTTWVDAIGTMEYNSFNDGQKTSDGGFIMTGITSRLGDANNDEAFIAKVNSAGANVFMKSVGTTNVSEDEEGYGIATISDGSYAVAGLHNNAVGPNFYLIKLSSAGFNCSSVQDNGEITTLAAPVFTATGSVSAPTTTSVSPSPAANTGGVITGGCITIPPVTLPIELLDFNGYNQNIVNVLNWSTASENNNDYFTIERSNNGINWEILGNVKGAGTSYSQNNYQLIDANPFSPITYYRLKQTDYDHQSKTSNIISIACCGNTKNTNYVIYPNPTTGEFSISTNEALKQGTVIEIINTIGQKVFEKTINADAKNVKIELNDAFSKGVYIILLRNNNEEVIHQQKFIKN